MDDAVDLVLAQHVGDAVGARDVEDLALHPAAQLVGDERRIAADPELRADDLVPGIEEGACGMQADETGPAGDEDFHVSAAASTIERVSKVAGMALYFLAASTSGSMSLRSITVPTSCFGCAAITFGSIPVNFAMTEAIWS